MGLKEWRARRAMKDPVRGEFRPSGSYFPHPGRVPLQEMMTGVVLAPGVPPTPAEVLNDLAGGHNGTMYDRLPALVDQAAQHLREPGASGPPPLAPTDRASSPLTGRAGRPRARPR